MSTSVVGTSVVVPQWRLSLSLCGTNNIESLATIGLELDSICNICKQMLVITHMYLVIN